MIARWPVPCAACDRKIQPGEQMERAAEGWVHLICDPGSIEWWLTEAAERSLTGGSGGWPA